MSAPERLPYEELRKRYGVGDIVYWGRRVLGFERDDPMTCPNCDPRATENAALRERAHDLFEAVEDAVNYYVCCEEYSADRCRPIIDRVSKVMGEHADWFYDDARPWMKPDAAPGGEGGTDGQ